MAPLMIWISSILKNVGIKENVFKFQRETFYFPSSIIDQNLKSLI
jgi:hypothetical protein